MKNLSVLTIPIATPPKTPPPVGQVYVFFDTEDQLQIMGADGMVEPLHLKKHTAQVTLTESFDIIDVIDRNELVVAGDVTDKIENRTVILINGSTAGTNDSVKIVRSTIVESGNTKLTIRRGNLDANLAEDGQVHIAKEVNIEHFLGTKAITFSLRNVATGESVDTSDKVIDEDNLVLMPSSPSLGDYLVTIVA
ncbi:MAG: hypothetical protein JXQ90_18350 [Cyclobacteriaceae bacterium]